MLGTLRPYRPVQGAAVAAATIELALRPASGVHIQSYPFAPWLAGGFAAARCRALVRGKSR